MLWTGSSVETAQIPQLSQQNRKKSWKVLSQYISELSLFKFSQSLSNSWLVMCCFSIFFSLEVHVFSVCYQVLPSDDYKCCKSQKREKLLSCFFFIMIFSCMLYQCCPECHDLPNVTKSWQCYVLVNLLFTKKWPLSVLLSSLTDSWNLIPGLMHNLWDSILVGSDVQVIVCFTFLWLFINRGMGWLKLGCWAFWNVVLFS